MAKLNRPDEGDVLQRRGVVFSSAILAALGSELGTGNWKLGVAGFFFSGVGMVRGWLARYPGVYGVRYHDNRDTS